MRTLGDALTSALDGVGEFFWARDAEELWSRRFAATGGLARSIHISRGRRPPSGRRRRGHGVPAR